MAKDCGCSKNAAGHLHAHPEYRHAIPALNWMMPCHPLFVPNQPPPPPPPCGCHHHMRLPHPGPVDYLPSRLYPDFWSDAHWMIPFPHMHHHHHGYWHGPFLPVPPPPPYPHHHPEQPVKPEPSGCTPRIYRKPTVVIDAGSNIKVSSIDTIDGTTSYIISAPNMTGATSKTNGKGGAVPAPMASDYGKFLSADGTWKYIKTNIVFDSEIFKGDGTESSPLYIDDMIPASDKKSGASGLVPAPQAGDDNSFLKGNGKWAKINIPKSVSDLEDAAEYLKTVDADSKYASKEWIGEHYLEQSAADDKFLSKESAKATYLGKANAEITYLSKESAANTYLSQEDASDTYLEKATAASTYATKEELDSTYLSKEEASNTYVDGTTAAATYLSKEDAADTYLDKSSAATTYLDKATAGTTYLSKEDATDTYLDKTTAGTTYLSKEDAADTYLDKTTAGSTYLTQETAASTYLSQEDAEGTYLDKSTAESTYLSKIDATDTYLDKTSAAGTYLGKEDASSTYLSKTDASSTYLTQDDAKDTYIGKDAIDNDLIVVKDEKVTVNVTTVGNTVTKIGNYYVSGSAAPSEKIFDNDDDEKQGKLWLYEDGTLTIDLDSKVSEIELYYSSKGTSQIQYYKIMTELLDAPKSNVGMFTTFKANDSSLLYSFEQVNVGYTSSETGSTIVITSLAGTDSEVKIERVYGSKE